MLHMPNQVRRLSPQQDRYAYGLRATFRERMAKLDITLDKFSEWCFLAYSLVKIGESFVLSG
jgi:hypothetical protein